MFNTCNFYTYISFMCYTTPVFYKFCFKPYPCTPFLSYQTEQGMYMLHGLKTINLTVTLYLYQLPIYGQ